jgi:hypothetical protein
MKPLDLNTSLAQESCLFEVPDEFAVEFSFHSKARVIFRALSVNAIDEKDLSCRLTYLSGERNILHDAHVHGKVGNVSYVNPNSIASREFAISIASTVSLTLDPILGAETVVIKISTKQPLFVRRDTIRLELPGKAEIVSPHSLLLTISELSKPRYLAHVTSGRHIFTSRSCIGAKGVIFTIDALDELGHRTKAAVGLVARLSTMDTGAIAVPRARRLERPERFNKEITIPEKTAYVRGAISTIASNAECFYDIFALKISRFRHAVGIPVGIALFEQLSLRIHENALSSSRHEFLALMQGD